MFLEVLKNAVLSDEELKDHLKGIVPDDVMTSEDRTRCICYVYSALGRTAIVLSEGAIEYKKEVELSAQEQIIKFS